MRGSKLTLVGLVALIAGAGSFWLTTRLVKHRPNTLVAAEPAPSATTTEKIPEPAKVNEHISWVNLFTAQRTTPPKDEPAKPAADKKTEPAAKNTYRDQVVPLFNKYCISCHNDKKHAAGLSLEDYKDETALMKSRKLMEAIKENVHSRDMPPKEKQPQPSQGERDTITNWIDTQLARVDCGATRDPGHPTIRRLNRAEYNNTIRDLVGVNFQPAEDFPSDDVGYGFDNIGDVLSMPPILLEKYLAAADKILNEAIVVQKPAVSQKDVFRPQNLFSSLGGDSKKRQHIALTSNGAAFFTFDFVHEGEYVLRVKAYGEQAGKDLPHLELQLDRKVQKGFDVQAVQGKSQVYEHRFKTTPGRHTLSAAYTNDFYDKEKKLDRNLYVEQMELEGPFNPVVKPLPEAHKRIMIASPTPDKDAAARKIIENFAHKAYRRPVQTKEIDRLMKLFKMGDADGEPFEKSVQLALKAVLVSSNFLFRIEKDKEPGNAKAIHPISDFELATRLSYFLWSSMPDDELFNLAEQNKLHDKATLEVQVKRMLKDPRSKALTENFAEQWLQLRTLQTIAPDKKTYPNFDGELKTAMARETELYFEHVVKEDRSILEFLDSNYSFLNAKLAKHYGIADVKGNEFRKVTLTDKNRGGLVTQASILTLTSNPTRTSPVKRGKWILDNIFGTPPPPPDPNAGMLKEDQQVVLQGTLRQRMEQHRANPACATCHQKMDPLGFGLENFDGVGTWRTKEGKFDIDSSGTLPGGKTFNGPAELRKILMGKADLFRRCLTEKMLTFALGRGVEYYDKCAIDEIVLKVRNADERFSALVLAVVESESFLKRRGK